MADLQHAAFVFGPNRSYLFSSKTERQRFNLPPLLELHFQQGFVWDVRDAALGWDGSYFLSYENQNGQNRFVLNDLPPRLERWLTGTRRDPKLALAPNGGFIAWDVNGHLTHNLPEQLAETLSRWEDESGWTNSRPKCVSLGKDGTFIAISRTGAMAHQLGYHYPSLTNHIRFARNRLGSTFAVGNSIHSISLNPFEGDVFTLVWASGNFNHNPNRQNVDVMHVDMNIVGLSISQPEKLAQEKPLLLGLKQILTGQAPTNSAVLQLRS